MQVAGWLVDWDRHRGKRAGGDGGGECLLSPSHSLSSNSAIFHDGITIAWEALKPHMPLEHHRAFGELISVFSTQLADDLPNRDAEFDESGEDPTVYFSPASVQSALGAFCEIEETELRQSVANAWPLLPNPEPDGCTPESADEFLDYVYEWKAIINEAVDKSFGLAIFCG